MTRFVLKETLGKLPPEVLAAHAAAVLAKLEHSDSGDHPLTISIWAMLGAFDQHEIGAWNPQIGEIMLWSYLVVSNIILVNLLIAMMGDTYSNVSQNAVVKWRLQRAKIALTLERAIPPGRRDRLDRGVWIDVARARFLQVQLVNGLTAIQSGAEA